MISDRVKKGPDKTPHRSLFKAMGYTDEELQDTHWCSKCTE